LCEENTTEANFDAGALKDKMITQEISLSFEQARMYLCLSYYNLI